MAETISRTTPRGWLATLIGERALPSPSFEKVYPRRSRGCVTSRYHLSLASTKLGEAIERRCES